MISLSKNQIQNLNNFTTDFMKKFFIGFEQIMLKNLTFMVVCRGVVLPIFENRNESAWIRNLDLEHDYNTVR